MNIFVAKVKTNKGLYEKPIAVPRRHVKVVQKFLDDLYYFYDDSVIVKSILGFRMDDLDYDEHAEDPIDDEEAIDSFPEELRLHEKFSDNRGD